MGSLRRLVVVALAAATLACAPAAPEESPGPAPAFNVVVILVDCLRADHMGAYGYQRPTTPNMDRLAAESIVFERAVSASNWTKPAVASLFTGAWVSQHRLTEGNAVAEGGEGPVRSQVLAPELDTLAELLSSAGMATGGFVNQGHLAGYMGFDQGFDRYRTGLGDHGVVQAFAGWMAGVRGRPFFAYLHFLDLHFPYTPQDHIDVFNDDILPRRMKSLIRDQGRAFRALVSSGGLSEIDHREVRGLYDGELLGADDTVRKALDVLRVNDLYDDTLVVLTSDHGEALFERGTFEHGGDLMHEEVLHVPLLVKPPGGQHAGRRITPTVSLVDVAPTVIASLGIPGPEGIGGLPLLTRAADGTLEIDVAEDRPILAEPTVPGAPTALYMDGFKFLFFPDVTGRSLVYDLTDDPGETVNLAASIDAPTLARARETLSSMLAANRAFAEDLVLTETELRPAEIAKLRALGYVQ